MKQRCINLDWLEVYALESNDRYPCNADYYRNRGYNVVERDYGTRIYAEMFTICDAHGQPCIEIRRNPFSNKSKDGGMFPAESCHLRLHNSMCYLNNAVSYLREFMALNCYIFKKIFRLDICNDFEYFDRGDDPDKFLQRFIQGRYSKVNQANISAHGKDQWSGRTWNSVSWGQPKSMVSTKMYNKTMELSEARDKPYIKQAWFMCHLIDNPVDMTKRKEDGTIYKPVIWRVEFSIKSSAQKWFIIERNFGKKGKIPMPHSLDMYDTREKLLQVFASLAMHYFHFKIYEDGVRKDRCRDKILFDFSALDTFYTVDRLASHTANNTVAQRLLAYLRNYALCHPYGEGYNLTKELIKIIEREILRNMNNPDYSHADIIALQQLIAQRIQGIKQDSIQQQLNDILTTIKSNPQLF